MTKPRTKSKVSGWLFYVSVILMIFSLSLVNSSYVFAAEKFSVDAEINLKKLRYQTIKKLRKQNTSIVIITIRIFW